MSSSGKIDIATIAALLLSASCTQPAFEAIRPASKVEDGATHEKCGGIKFPSKSKSKLSQPVLSEALILAECVGPVSISVSGDGSPQLFKNNARVELPATAENGDTLQIQIESSSREQTLHRAIISIGARNTEFIVTTGDFTPTAFVFTPDVERPLASLVTSNIVTLDGFDGEVTASVTGEGSPTLLVNGNEVGPTAKVAAGNGVAVQMTSSATENTSHSAVLTIGTVISNYDVTTKGDARSPVLTSILGPRAGSYRAGQNLDFVANFSENVLVKNHPRILLDIGGSKRYARYVSGTGTPQIIFRYSVEEGLNDPNGVLIGNFQNQAGQIEDVSGNAADLDGVTVDTSNVLVDTLAPRAIAVAVPQDGWYVGSHKFLFELNFSEPLFLKRGTTNEVPCLNSKFGNSPRDACLVSADGSEKLSFALSVMDGDYDGDGIELLGSIDLRGAELTDSAGNIVLTSFAAPFTPGLKAIDCPINYVPITREPPYTNDLVCVAKYEMKNNGGFAESKPEGKPWNQIDRSEAVQACSRIGSKYHLMTNNEWQAVARKIERVPLNWSDQTIGASQKVNTGYTDDKFADYGLEASAEDDLSCVGLFEICSLSDWSQKRRIHFVDGTRTDAGRIIWDFSGNVDEWISDVIQNPRGGINTSAIFLDRFYYNHLINLSGTAAWPSDAFAPQGSYINRSDLNGSTPTLGHVYLNYFQDGIVRGSSFTSSTEGAGVYSASTFAGDGRNRATGFRCAWTP